MADLSTTAEEFAQQMMLLIDASAFLSQEIAGKSVSNRAGDHCVAEFIVAKGRIQTLTMERPNRPCALILGEFKAGKSTLINALIGKVVAASDVFELTQVVCRVVPTTGSEYERVELISRTASHPKVMCDLETFVKRAAARELDDFSFATAFVYSDLSVVLVDTPGLGATLKHELDALDALATADIALCVIDSESLGGGRDAATIARMQEIDLPFICVLTKADALAPNEIPLVTDYIIDNLGVASDRIFPVSAQQAIELGTDPGIQQLSNFLRERVAPNGAHLRSQALLAQAHDVASILAKCFDQVIISMNDVVREVKGYSLSLKDIAEAVTNDLCNSLSTMLHDKLRLEIEKATLGRNGNITEDDFTEALRTCFSGELEKEFLQKMQDQLDTGFHEEWSEAFKQNINLLKENLEAMKGEADFETTQQIQRELLNEQLKEQAVNEATGSLVSGAAVATGVIILVHAFIPGALFAVPFLVSAWKKIKEAGQHHDNLRDPRLLQSAIDQWREEVIREKVMGEFRPKLLALNREVADKAADNYARKQQTWPMSHGELNHLYLEARRKADILVNVSHAPS